MKVLYLCALVFVYVKVGQASTKVRGGKSSEKSSECECECDLSSVNSLISQLEKKIAQLENEISSLQLQISSISVSNSTTNTTSLANRITKLESCISCNTENAGLCVWYTPDQWSLSFKNDSNSCDINYGRFLAIGRGN